MNYVRAPNDTLMQEYQDHAKEWVNVNMITKLVDVVLNWGVKLEKRPYQTLCDRENQNVGFGFSVAWWNIDIESGKCSRLNSVVGIGSYSFRINEFYYSEFFQIFTRYNLPAWFQKIQIYNIINIVERKNCWHSIN